jgi:hypothetical protein
MLMRPHGIAVTGIDCMNYHWRERECCLLVLNCEIYDKYVSGRIKWVQHSSWGTLEPRQRERSC